MADEEIEILQSIYGTDLVVGRNTGQNWSDIVLSMKIVPILSKSKCVTSVRTVIELSEQYPKVPPKVYLREPRGFDENNLNILERKVEQHIEKNSEMHILYDIFQMVKDFLLDEQNVPCSFCPICLNKFKDGTTIICTPQCSHYIHSHCFARYVDHWRGQVAAELNQWPLDMRSKVDQVLKCPVCREPIDQNELSEIKKVPINLNNDDDDEFNFNWEEWKKKLKELQVLLDHQKAKGGLIDPEEERKRFLIGVESVSSHHVQFSLKPYRVTLLNIYL
ncbi:unnamed protein product [Thelazia callipaeda]|uniref:RING-type domain-containing protein n=1 Tax=Thelazia callipaeda TaxID=103827 RepID=A0A0N5D772_THECL|nr:unnamed protein product [Thelazia callipaeda]